ncbi:FGD6 isoform 4 [Pan troglodytes]|uniref:FYVE, RhoGEF and PH domain containing 6 n=2 Tax=Homininae TaxID=207598 RepID=F8VWT6_HUMAN|nr:FYVE, RhoGEF and PH domain containing 6 [Homo sapiens]KAI4067623.1 FYVE, RhoGEF and PH domain containing 6 [Homo sapiens]PNI39063.1 FGD6 isoform 4 [Pan troglodytes]
MTSAAVQEHPRRNRMILVLVTFPLMRRKSSTVLMKMMSALSQVKESLTHWKINRMKIME